MSFQIRLQYNESPKNQLDKKLTSLGTVSGVLKEGTSIIDPVFQVVDAMSNLRYTNYCTIESFGRSYFVTDIKSIRQDLLEISCHVDVLTTFKDQIRTNNAIIRRNEYATNKLLNDGFFKVYQNPNIVLYEFPQGFTSYEWVLAMAGS